MQSAHLPYPLAAYLMVALSTPAPAWGPMPEPEPQRAPLMATPAPPAQAAKDRPQIAERELDCLALTVYWEAGRESHEGQRAVAHVVLNRRGQPGFPTTICGVVHQGGPHFPCQFQWYCSGNDTRPSNQVLWDKTREVARHALVESDNTNGALFFHQAALNPEWSRRRTGTKVIGHHIFFRGLP